MVKITIKQSNLIILNSDNAIVRGSEPQSGQTRLLNWYLVFLR